MTGKQARRRQLLRTIGLHFSGMDVLKALGLYLVAVMCCLLLRSFVENRRWQVKGAALALSWGFKGVILYGRE